ncbi:MAG: CPBP family intramembrane metalloprotease [Clostridia bacterium]|nr:CPBP family intramembrane metalloprotease [Clostridia bacterium]
MESNANPQGGQNKYSIPLGARGGGLSYSAAVVINLVLGIFASILIVAFSLNGTEAATYLSLITSPIAIAVVLTLALTVAKQPVKSLLPVKCQPKYFLIAVLIVFGALFSLSWVNEYVIRLFELMGYTRSGGINIDVSGWKIVPALIVVAVIPAFMEEILFRGIILNNAEGDVGSINAIFITGLCFSLYHGSVEQTLYQFIIGCLFGFIAVRSRSIAPTVLIHFINNALIIILQACGLYDASGQLIISAGGEIALYVISGASLIGGIVWLILDKTQLKPVQKRGVGTFFLWAVVGIAVMAVFWIVGLFTVQ